MIKIKSPHEIEKMARSGAALAKVLQETLVKVAPGVSTLELDKYAQELIIKAGGLPSFKMEKNYFHATCMCVNEAVVHGVPNGYLLKNGDVLGVDMGLVIDGWHADASWSVRVGGPKGDSIDTFLAVGQKALDLAIEQCVVGNHVGNISDTIENVVNSGGYSSVKQVVGHGIGRELHEDPDVPCYSRGNAKNTPELKEGMVLAVEVIYNMGGSPIVYGSDDGWTIVTRDGLPSGLFEHTVAITASGPKILTSCTHGELSL